MNRNIIAFILGCFLLPLVVLAQSPGGEEEKPKFVLILNSYSYEKEWSTALAKEIRNAIEAQQPGVLVNITYADIEARTSFLADRFAMQGAFAYGRLNNKIIIPDVLVLIGDESWMLYRIMDHKGIWEKVPVVLCGIHTEILKDYQSFFQNRQLPDTAFIPLYASVSASLITTAVVEPDCTTQTLQLAHTLVPQLHDLYYLSDGSYADAYIGKKLKEGSRQSNLSFCSLQLRRNNMDSVVQVLKKIPPPSVVITNGVPVPIRVDVPVLTLREVDFGTYMPAGGYFSSVSAIADKTVDAVFQFLDEQSVDSSSYSVVPDAAFYLNETALLHANLRSAVKNLPGAVNRNIPPPFIFRHLRIIVLSSLLLIILAFVICRIIHTRSYRLNLNMLFERYKTLYDEYRVVYENMPVGLMLFDITGKMLKHNAEASVFLNRLACPDADEFQLFTSDIVDDAMRQALLQEELVAKVVYLKESCYRIQCCLIVDEETEANHILMVVIDNTAIEKEKKEKQKISNILNFAMNKAMIGVSEYNLVDGLGFATDAWYDTLEIERGVIDFSQAHQCLVPADREKLVHYLDSVRGGASSLFLENLQMQTRAGETHFIRCLIQPLEYAPQQGQIIVAGLILNVDEEIGREQELKAAMGKAQEADRFKNAFVANMRDEIRIPLQEVILCARELVATDNANRRKELNARVEAANDKILKLLNDIIDVSKVELNE